MKTSRRAGKDAAQVWLTSGARVMVTTRLGWSAPELDRTDRKIRPSENVKVEMTTSFQGRAWPNVARPLVRGSGDSPRIPAHIVA